MLPGTRQVQFVLLEAELSATEKSGLNNSVNRLDEGCSQFWPCRPDEWHEPVCELGCSPLVPPSCFMHRIIKDLHSDCRNADPY